MIKRFLFLIITALISVSAVCQEKERISFNSGWMFSLNGRPAVMVNLPHDWAIKGDFSENNPSGTGGGALPGGVGLYRKTFDVSPKDSTRLFRLDFDGVYMNSSVSVNGHNLGTRPYGYISFSYDITPYLKYGEENVIEVKVDNSEQPNSRWYSGCGIYRNVWLVKHDKVHIAKDGVQVTYSLDKIGKRNKSGQQYADRVHVDYRIAIVNEDKYHTAHVRVRNTLRREKGTYNVSTNYKVVDIPAGDTVVVEQKQTLNRIILWDVENPYLYKVETEISHADEGKNIGYMFGMVGALIDAASRCGKGLMFDASSYFTHVGFRKIDVSDNGLYINGRHIQVQGVCMHHDQGCLGAAVNRRAIQRQLEILKGMGINGIRCSHNPPAPELLDLCDQMGFLVMDEAFDMWRKKKTAHDYARYFNEWHERDLRDFIVRDRNHPSVFMWSIGNEVLEQWTDANADTLSLEEANLILNFGHGTDMLAKDGEEMSVNSLLTRKLTEIVHGLDSSRPVTAGCNEPNKYNHLFKSGALDVIGFNYHNQNIPDVPDNFPGKPFIITESNSALMTRGYYRMPSDNMYIWPERWDKPFYDSSFSCSSYENCHVPWGNTNEENLILLKKFPWICGQYVWTGFDYIGEPTPYGWPARSSYFGIVDLAGFPKDVYYLYQSELTSGDVLHLFPHWTWNTPQAREMLLDGKQIDMWTYYNNADEVELFVNGKSQGVRSKNDSTLHAMWRVDYEPGKVVAISRKNGIVVKTDTIRTAGTPAAIRLTPDRSVIDPDGTDLSFVTVEITDKDGNLCPWADNLIHFAVEGNAYIAGVDNGSPTSLERFDDNKRKAFYGKCLVVLQNNGDKGTAKLTAVSNGLKTAEVIIKAK